MICPKCKSEYREGIEECADCGCKLVEALSADSETKSDASQQETLIEMMQPVRIYSSEDFMLLERIRQSLEEEDIPCMIRAEGAEGYFDIRGGNNFYRKSVYVDEKEEQRAREILSTIVAPDHIEPIDTADEDTGKSKGSARTAPFAQRRRWAARISGIICLLIVVLFGVLSFLL